jgi:hypothetical protein
MALVTFPENQLAGRNQLLGARVEAAIQEAAAPFLPQDLALSCRIVMAAERRVHVNISRAGTPGWVIAFGVPLESSIDALRKVAQVALGGCSEPAAYGAGRDSARRLA